MLIKMASTLDLKNVKILKEKRLSLYHQPSEVLDGHTFFVCLFVF